MQLQIRLHEADGSFDIIFKDWNPNDDAMVSYLSLKVGAKGDDGDILLLADSYTDLRLAVMTVILFHGITTFTLLTDRLLDSHRRQIAKSRQHSLLNL